MCTAAGYRARATSEGSDGQRIQEEISSARIEQHQNRAHSADRPATDLPIPRQLHCL